MSAEIDLFRSFIADKGLRNTPEREEIIREIFASREHFDVDELYLRLRKKGSAVSKASIYRNIPLIMECDLIREAWHEDGHMHYEPFFGHGHHCHLRCVQCGKVIEFVEKDLKTLENRLAKKYDFRIIEHRLEVSGYCSDCQ
ncbi:MAG: transcriptional repressor [Proteobacteria bacterium]|nr:transcriptional repressor [Pseudomonadota bacterium]